MMQPKTPKPKVSSVSLIPRETDGRTHQTYRLMDELIASNHPHLAEAKIALAWKFNWKPDKDGRLKLGKCEKASDLNRELHDYDFVILLNSEAWNAADWAEKQMNALLDHELCHAAVSIDDNGEIVRDAGGRPVWRVRGHDVEEFREIVARHGLWKGDLEAFAKTAMEATKAPLLRLTGTH